VAKNRAQQRAQAKRQMNKQQRRRQQKMRTIRIWSTVAGALALALVLFFVFRGDGGGTVSPGSPSATGPTAPTTESSSPCPGAPTKTCYKDPPPMVIDASKSYTATMKTNMGDIVIDLNTRETPKTVNNFVFLAREGFYDGLVFHRVIPGFMIQGGDPAGNGTGDPGYKFEDETKPTDSFDKPGLLAMANSGPNTNGSQFFITVDPATHLNGKHTIFGTVTKGMDVVEKIVSVETGAQDRPVKPVTITTVEIAEK